jgi:hypothetical protein
MGILKYYDFYSTHHTTRKYNPFVLALDAGICTPAVAMLILCDAKTFQARFHHPFERLLREPAVMFIEIYTIQTGAFTVREGQITYDITLPRFGEVIVGIVHDESFIRGSFRLHANSIAYIYRVNITENIHAVAYNISSDLAAINNGSTEYLESLRTAPPRICSISHGVVPMIQHSMNLANELHLEVTAPMTHISLVYGFMNQDYIDMLKKETEFSAMI